MKTGRVVFTALALAALALPELTAAQDNWALQHYVGNQGGGGMLMWLVSLMPFAFIVAFGISVGLWRSILMVAIIVTFYGTLIVMEDTLGVIGAIFAGSAATAVVWKVLDAVLPIPDEDK